MEKFQANIKQWVHIDTQLRTLREQVNELRERRAKLGEDILIHVDANNLANATVNISDGKLRFGSTRQTAPLTLKYTQCCLRECISDPEQVSYIMGVIKGSREVNVSTGIKRSYNE
jgi:hypothetical protein